MTKQGFGSLFAPHGRVAHHLREVMKFSVSHVNFTKVGRVELEKKREVSCDAELK